MDANALRRLNVRTDWGALIAFLVLSQTSGTYVRVAMREMSSIVPHFLRGDQFRGSS